MASGMGNRVKTMIATTLVLCFGLEFVKGGCLSYGHSCWGGHGKRSGPPVRYAARSFPTPLMSPPELWPSMVKGKSQEGKPALFAISNNGYYQPLARMFQIPSAAMIKILGSDSAPAASGSDGESPTEVNDDDEENTMTDNSNHSLLKEDPHRLEQQRRKTAIIENESAGSNSSDDEDFGELLLRTPTTNRGSNLLKLLSPTSYRKYNQSA